MKHLEIINSSLIVGYKDCIIIYDLKSGLILKTIHGFSKFQKNFNQVLLYSFNRNEGNSCIRNLDNSIYYECNYPIKEFIYWNSRIITSNSLFGILGSEISLLGISTNNDKVLACTRNTLCLLSI